MAHAVSELYWRGNRKIALKPDDVKGSSLENRIRALTFLNRAFELFYECRQGIARCSDTQMRERMTRELEAAATSGPRQGECDDLKEGIEHATAEKSKRGHSAPFQWRDRSLATYLCIRFHGKMAFDAYDSRRPTIWQEGDVSSAKAAVLFLEEMDERVSLLQAKFAWIEERSRSVHRAGVRLHRSSVGPGDTDWKALGNGLKSIALAVSQSQQYMWLSAARLEERFNRLTSYLGSGASVLGVARQLTALGDRMIKGLASLGSVKEALELLCVLGSFYARALDMIPGAKIWINEIYASRWNEVSLLAGEARGTRLAQMESASGVLSGASALRAYPFLGSYRDARSLGIS